MKNILCYLGFHKYESRVWMILEGGHVLRKRVCIRKNCDDCPTFDR